MDRCPECGRGGRGFRLSPPELLTLAAGEIVEVEGALDGESFGELVLLRRHLRRAYSAVNDEIDRKAHAAARGFGYDDDPPDPI